MTDIKEAIAFVRQNGDQLDHLRLQNALGEPFTHSKPVEILSHFQFPDGSWDYETRNEISDSIGSLGGTIHCLRWIREFSLGDSQMMTRTINFLESIQSPDGSFYETEEKLAHSPQAWLQEETLIDCFYFTAAVPMRLYSLGHKDQPVVEPAIHWLERHWSDWSLVTGTWYNLWALLCIHLVTKRLSTSIYRRCFQSAMEWIPNLEARSLTWLLDALQGAGFSKEESLIAEGITRLLNLQDEHGYWDEGKPSAVETTVTALRVLLDYGCIPIPEN